MTNQGNNVLYTGVTNNLKKRVFKHKQKLDPKSFTARYNINKLVYYEVAESSRVAIRREKSIKNLVRRKKMRLINKFNPTWRDLYKDL